jgi:MFS family permease
MEDIMKTKSNYLLTLFILCCGYFIDFYDLSIMGISYNELIKQQFKLTSIPQIQQTYLLISNCQTLGIFLGALGFGYLGDRLGRAQAIKFSILLYSLATLAAIFCTNLPMFLALRMLAYAGLASEFATSTILILELTNRRNATYGTLLLYGFGVLGGLTATLIGTYSWKIMFLGGGVAGLGLYLVRSQLNESTIYLAARTNRLAHEFGNWRTLFAHPPHLIKLLKHWLLIIPYFALISFMFILPNFIIKSYSLAYATKILLFGFFIGNIISCGLSIWLLRFHLHLRSYMGVILLSFLLLLLNYQHIPENLLWVYCGGLGLLGGGYPVIWTQTAARDFPLAIRSLASGTLTALGRGSGIIFNLLISSWLITPNAFSHYASLTFSIVFILAISSLFTLKSYVLRLS